MVRTVLYLFARPVKIIKKSIVGWTQELMVTLLKLGAQRVGTHKDMSEACGGSHGIEKQDNKPYDSALSEHPSP